MNKLAGFVILILGFLVIYSTHDEITPAIGLQVIVGGLLIGISVIVSTYENDHY